MYNSLSSIITPFQPKQNLVVQKVYEYSKKNILGKIIYKMLLVKKLEKLSQKYYFEYQISINKNLKNMTESNYVVFAWMNKKIIDKETLVKQLTLEFRQYKNVLIKLGTTVEI